MPFPTLTFYCELESEPLQTLFQEPEVIQDLSALNAAVSLSIQDFSSVRADVVKQLNRANIPVTAWLLLPKEQGYYFNIDNYPEAVSHYQRFYDWTNEHGLHWSGIGLDIEPDIRLITTLARGGRRALLREAPGLIQRALNRRRYKDACYAYEELIDQIHANGFFVESYQFPVLADERNTRSTLLQRLSGVVDIPADREVWMLYSSFMQRKSPGYLWSYAPQAQAIGLGSTGGGADAETFNLPILDWEELARDLRLAWYWSDQLYIFSLEGCVEQGILNRLRTMSWDQPILFPSEAAEAVNARRRALQGYLWVNKNSPIILAILMGGFVLVETIRRIVRRRRSVITY